MLVFPFIYTAFVVCTGLAQGSPSGVPEAVPISALGELVQSDLTMMSPVAFGASAQSQSTARAEPVPKWEAAPSVMEELKQDPFIVGRLAFFRPRIIRGLSPGPVAVAFCTNDQRFAVADKHDVTIWDVADEAKPQHLVLAAPRTNALATSPNGAMLAAGGDDSALILYKTANGEYVDSFKPAEPRSPRSWIGGPLSTPTFRAGKPILALAFSPDGGRLASAGVDKSITIWDVQTRRRMQQLVGHDADVSGLAFTPDGNRLISGSADKTVRLWNAQDGTQTKAFGQPSPITALALNANGSLLASAGTDGSIRLSRIPDGKVLRTLTGHSASVRDVLFSPSGTLLASASEDGTVRLWSTKTGAWMFTFRFHSGPVDDVSFSPDGWVLASASTDGTVVILDLHIFQGVLEH